MYLIFIILIAVVPIFFFWHWILKRIIKDRVRTLISSGILTIASTLAAYPLMISFLIFGLTYYPVHHFDRNAWQANKEKRYELSKHLIESKMLIGKSKTEVREILGEEGNEAESNSWIYYLGFRPGISNIDPDFLNIEFCDDKVVQVEQHEN